MPHKNQPQLGERTTTGPETSNREAAVFEAQVLAMGTALGWSCVHRNSDYFLPTRDGKKRRRGVDLLWAVENPQTGKGEGWLGEAKRHDSSERYTQALISDELHTLRHKVRGLADADARFYSDPEIAPHIQRMGGGLLVHRTPEYSPDKLSGRLRDTDMQELEQGAFPTRLAFIGPDTLNGLAETFHRAGEPARFLWPPTPYSNAAWSLAAPPLQVAAGMFAYEARDGRQVLWIRDGLEASDIDALPLIGHWWGIRLDVVVCTQLSSEGWRHAADRWRLVAAQYEKRDHGSLPPSPVALNVQHLTLREFDQQWPGDHA